MTASFQFGPFLYFPARRQLEREGKPIKIASRSLDLLQVLIERRGSFIDKVVLTELVWPNVSVDEGSLRVHMSGLRKALGEQRSQSTYIQNLPGKGYCFVAPVVEGDRPAVEPTGEHRGPPLPMITPRIIGRDRFINSVISQMETQRLMTLAGPGGVGKTTVAIAIAQSIREAGKEIYFVDLASVPGPEFVRTSLASALELGAFSDDPLMGVLAFLATRNVLLVLDNCEHVLGAVKMLVETLLSADDSVSILTTSREPLGASGETVRSLRPLRIPPLKSPGLSPEELMAFPAVRMFVDRTQASARELKMDGRSLQIVGDICRQLDGIPLAIEFAAARVEEFGVAGLLSRLGDQYALLTKGRRTAVERQKTLRNTMDWSYKLLSPEERSVLLRLSIYAQVFEMDGVRVVVGQDEECGSSLDTVVASLVSKSLLVPSSVGDRMQYRMLAMTRDFAHEKLVASGRLHVVSRRHAVRVLEILARAEADWTVGATREWTDVYAPRLGDLRRAMNWAFSEHGDVELGVRLGAASTILMTPLGLMEEHRREIERALAANALLETRDRLMDARLYSSLGALFFYTRGHLDDALVCDAFRAGIDAAREVGDVALQLRAISGLSAGFLTRGLNERALKAADEFAEVPGGAQSKAAYRTLAHSNHYCGNVDQSAYNVSMALGVPPGGRDVEGFGAEFDQEQTTVRTTQAANLFHAGRADTALKIIEKSVPQVTEHNHLIAITHLLARAACPVAFMALGWAAAAPYVDALVEISERNSMAAWSHFAVAYRALMSDRRFPDEETFMRETGLGSPLFGNKLQVLCCLGDGFTETWMYSKAMKTDAGFCQAELYRGRGLMFLDAENDKASAELYFRKALAESATKNLLAWEIRAAMSIARLLSGEGRREEGQDLLAATMAKFTEGFGTVDYRAAMVLRSEIAG